MTSDFTPNQRKDLRGDLAATSSHPLVGRLWTHEEEMEEVRKERWAEVQAEIRRRQNTPIWEQ